MAEAIVSSIAGEIVAILGSQAEETVGKLQGVKYELEELKKTVSILQAVLNHAEEQYYQSSQIRVWIEQLKDAFYDAQDVIEEFNIEAKRRELKSHNEIMKMVRTFFSSSNQLAFKLKMSGKVRVVRKRIEAIEARKRLTLEERPVDTQVEGTHSHTHEGDIKGREADKEAIKEFLLASDVHKNVSVLPIVGIGGLGKTALAKYVYNDEMISKHFQLKMWVCVSNNFDMKKILKNMIACAKKESAADTMERLQIELRGEIDGKRYLLVLDDWWTENQDAWYDLSSLLSEGATGSKILITTRLHSIVDITGATSPCLLQGLFGNAALDLLLQMACPKKEETPNPDLLVIGKEILKKCYGVPLVIRTVGNLLSSKKSKLEWSKFKDEELPNVFDEENIKSVLQLSYNHLPPHLKQCFAFCSLFPKDHEIEIQTLVDLWVSNGFIRPSKKTQHLEDTGRKYCMNLLWGNFFQDLKKDPFTGRETCKMHDLMHDLACLVAGVECRMVGDDTKSLDERTRHISLGGLSISRLKASPLRTFLSVVPQKRSEADLHHLMQSFKRLHILDLHASYVEKVPRSIGESKYLTYLDFSENYKLKRLPNSITKLQNLQMLNLRGCCSLEELPRDIQKLVSLRNLDIDDCQALSYMPKGLGQLTSLHRLTRFILPEYKGHAENCCGLGELKELNQIRGSLCIENLGNVTHAIGEFKDANLEGKGSLETLILKWGHSKAGDAKAPLDELKPHSKLWKLTIDGYQGENFPRWMTALPNLVELRLWHCKCKHLPPLGRLSSLVDLSIGNCEELYLSKEESGNIISNSHDGLNSLRSVSFKYLPKLASLPRWLLQSNNLQDLHIEYCRNLKELPEQIEALQSLQRLDIHGCHSLTSLPEGIRRLASLTHLTILSCKELDLSKDESGNIISDFHDGLESLRSVTFVDLPKLASLPRWLLQSNNLQHLYIGYCLNLKELPEQIEALQSLQQLEIHACHSLTSLPEGIRRLASLTHLSIADCEELDLSKDESGDIISDFHDGLNSLRSVEFHYLPKLASLPRWIPQATNLESLRILNCNNFRELLEQLDSSKEESGNIISDFRDGLKSLRSVEFNGLPKLASLPRWIPQAKNLESLQIWHCQSLKELPERIDALQSLRRLRIMWCPSLTSLPEGMRRLTSLSSLKISGCPELEERCKRDEGEDWHKIAHVPRISRQFW